MCACRLSEDEGPARRKPSGPSTQEMRSRSRGRKDLSRLFFVVGMLIIALVAVVQQNPVIDALIPILAGVGGYLFGGHRQRVPRDS